MTQTGTTTVTQTGTTTVIQTGTTTIIETGATTVAAATTQTGFTTITLTNKKLVTSDVTLTQTTTSATTSLVDRVQKRQATVTPSAIPAYAGSACHDDVAAYVSACSCFGATVATTFAATPLTTVTVTATTTATSTASETTVATSIATTVSTSTATVVSTSTVTVTSTSTATVVATSTASTDETSTVVRSTTTTALATATARACGANPSNFRLRVSDGTWLRAATVVSNPRYLGLYMGASREQAEVFSLVGTTLLTPNRLASDGLPNVVKTVRGTMAASVFGLATNDSGNGGAQVLPCTLVAGTNQLTCSLYGQTMWSDWGYSDRTLSIASNLNGHSQFFLYADCS